MNRPGSSEFVHALVLQTTVYREDDLIVHVLCQNIGLISCFARKARQSKKRFAGCLDPLVHIRALLKVPREQHLGEKLWTLEKAELVDSFDHLRHRYDTLDTGLFILKLVRDMVPEGHEDPELFKALGRFLKSLPPHSPHMGTFRASFWVWLAAHLGFGNIAQSLEPKSFFEQLQNRPNISFEKVFAYIQEYFSTPLSLENEVKVYESWLNASGMHWPYFQSWLSSASITKRPLHNLPRN